VSGILSTEQAIDAEGRSDAQPAESSRDEFESMIVKL